MKSRKQFISMAVCPGCQAMDTTVMYDEDGHRFRECVSCGFKDELVESAGERTEHPEPPKDDSVSVVTIFDPRKVKKSP